MEVNVKDHIFYNDHEYEVAKIVNKAGKQMFMCMPVGRPMGGMGEIPAIQCSMMCIPAESVRPAAGPATR